MCIKFMGKVISMVKCTAVNATGYPRNLLLTTDGWIQWLLLIVGEKGLVVVIDYSWKWCCNVGLIELIRHEFMDTGYCVYFEISLLKYWIHALNSIIAESRLIKHCNEAPVYVTG